MSLSPINLAFGGVLGLLAIGMYGLLVKHNLLKLVISLQILGKAAILALITAGVSSHQINLGQSLTVTVIVADTIVTIVALALAVQVQRRFGTLDVRELSTLKG
jgi:NADH:ubiquinone oxidoreductase subunit K